jgi:Bacterial transcriptional activator domain
VGAADAALYRCRRQSEALAVHQQARGVLLDGLGIEPGPGLRELQRTILEQSPSLELGVGRASWASTSSWSLERPQRRRRLPVGRAQPGWASRITPPTPKVRGRVLSPS